MDPRQVVRAVGPLTLIFWGGLLCIFDFTFTQTTNGQGFKCDVLNDALGVLLILVGVVRLSAIRVHDRYARAMTFIQIVAVLALLDALRAHIVMKLPDVIQAALHLFGVVKLIAVIAFCVAMRWLCEAAGLHRAARSWSVTTILFVVLYLLPLGMLYLIMAGSLATGKPFKLDLGPAGLLLLVVFVVPVIHLFVSTSRMKRAAEAASVMEPDEPNDGI